MRFLTDICLRIREKVGPEFPVGVKLNFSDFSLGGRSAESTETALLRHHTKMIGLARPMVIYPDLPHKIMNKEIKDVQTPHLTTGLPFLDSWGSVTMSSR